MSMQTVDAAPFILDHPWVQLGPTGTGVEISCAGTNLTATADQDENTIETFCGSYTSYKAPKWTVTFTLAQSYGADGSWTLIHPLCGTVVPFVIKPDQATASVDNPVMSGTCVVKQLPFIDAAPGEASEIDLVLAVQGDPDFGIVDPTVTAATAPATAGTQPAGPAGEGSAA
jgi:hypothetical protein